VFDNANGTIRKLISMAIRVLMRGGIYILFIVGAAVGWFLKRRQRTKAGQAQTVVSASTVEPANALQHPQWQVRLNAVQQLAEQKQPENLSRLIAMLNDSDSDVRDAAVEAVAAYGASAVANLSALLKEGHLNSREAAARALGMIGDPAAAPALMNALEDESVWVRIQAANALGGLGTGEAVNALAKALENETDAAAKQALQTALNALAAN
jgi:HEAT repeat protein